MAMLTKFLLLALLALLTGPVVAAMSGMARLGGDWRTANRDSAGIAPDPATLREPLVQVYGARAFGWRGAFAVHTWIAVKRRDAEDYTVYQVIGWRYWHGQNPLAQRRDRHPDRNWFGAEPEIYLERRGAAAEVLIDKIEAAVAAYPYQHVYRTWPGPNSNTFTAYVARSVPELRLDLPPTAIGKDYLGQTTFADTTPSGTGYQVSLFGALGLLAGVEEGVEINLLGLTLGIDPLDLALKLPGIGRLAPGSG
jgi:hypothetical protein